MTTKCSDTTKGGKPCSWAVWGDGARCLTHAARAGDPAALELLSARGSAGRARQVKQRAAAARGRRSSCSLRTPDALFAELERALCELERAGGDGATKAKTKVAIITAAADLIKHNLERDTKRLDELLAKHPQLVRHLRPVPEAPKAVS